MSEAEGGQQPLIICSQSLQPDGESQTGCLSIELDTSSNSMRRVPLTNPHGCIPDQLNIQATETLLHINMSGITPPFSHSAIHPKSPKPSTVVLQSSLR